MLPLQLTICIPVYTPSHIFPRYFIYYSCSKPDNKPTSQLDRSDMVGTFDFEACIITHGPWGGSQGKEWVYRPQGHIRKIIVNFGSAVDLIQFQTHDCKGEIQSSSFGKTGGRETATISIDHPLEYLVSISGTFGIYVGYDVVKSICFKTNVTCYGPYGIDSGTAFSYDGKGGMILGFHGRAHDWLTAIGVYVMPESLASALISSTSECKIMPKLCSSLTMPREVGPWGGGGGKPWDDGVFATVKQVNVHVGDLNVIYALQFEYLKKDGKSVLSHIHGGTTDEVKNIKVVNLDDKDEFLTGISGFHGPDAIRSISFYTNKRVHGPYGEERCVAGCVYYSSTPSLGKIVGFHGRNIRFLSAIGVHMEYF